MSDEINYLEGLDLDEALAPQEGGLRSRFGALTIHLTPIKFEKGAEGYTIPGVTNFDGSPKFYKGKTPVKNKAGAFHVVFVLEQTDQEGGTYTRAKDTLTGSKTYRTKIYPSMLTHLGGKEGVRAALGNVRYVRVEEVPTGRTFEVTNDAGEAEEHQETLWTIAEVYPTAEAMNAAADEFFEQFRNEDGEVIAEGVNFPVPDMWQADPNTWAAEMPKVIETVQSLANGSAPTPPIFAKAAEQHYATVDEIAWVWANRDELPTPY